MKPQEMIHQLWIEKRFQEGVSASAQWYEASRKPMALAWEGRFLQRLNRHDEAIELLEQAYAADVNAAWLCEVYARSLIKQARYKEAGEIISAEIQKSGADTKLGLLNLQQDVYRYLKQWEQARQAGSRSLGLMMRDKPYSRAAILQKLINKLGVQNYLEIGVNDGSTFLKLEAPTKLAVDPRFRVPGGVVDNEHERWFEITSDEFFQNQAECLRKNHLDLVFIDGLHTYEQSLADVHNSLKYLRPGGLILMHDCQPTSAAAAAPTTDQARALRGLSGKGGAGGAWMGDVYRTILHLRSFNAELQVCVLDSDCGLGFVRPGKSESMLNLNEEQVRSFSYHDLVSKKELLLNLKPTEWFDAFLENLPELTRKK